MTPRSAAGPSTAFPLAPDIAGRQPHRHRPQCLGGQTQEPCVACVRRWAAPHLGPEREREGTSSCRLPAGAFGSRSSALLSPGPDGQLAYAHGVYVSPSGDAGRTLQGFRCGDVRAGFSCGFRVFQRHDGRFWDCPVAGRAAGRPSAWGPGARPGPADRKWGQPPCGHCGCVAAGGHWVSLCPKKSVSLIREPRGLACFPRGPDENGQIHRLRLPCLSRLTLKRRFGGECQCGFL